jgi:uncharacterized DUF497 family protein
MLRFEWNEKKNRSNRRKHGVWLEETQSAFHDPNSRLFDDPEHSDDEDRFILVGISSTASGRRSLLQEIRLGDSDYFRAEGNQEGVYVL